MLQDCPCSYIGLFGELILFNKAFESNIWIVVIFLLLRCSILDLAYCIVDGSDGDLVNILFSIIKHSMQVR